MTPHQLVSTAVLLGLFVLAGGAYGGLYGAARLKDTSGYLVAGYACYAAQAALMVAIVVATPLAPVWKFFIVSSGLAYAFIPRVTWRYLERLHATEDS